jgi:hypothetical protein
VDTLSPTTVQSLIQVYGLWVLFPVVAVSVSPAWWENCSNRKVDYGVAGVCASACWHKPNEMALFFLDEYHRRDLLGFAIWRGRLPVRGGNQPRTGPVRLLLLVAAIGLVIAGILFFRHRERELEQRADAALRGM